ncbi:MAG: hypothetical protein SF029_09205 [bacterium]|nr:hypothetical protein [bacterium]
MTQSKDTQRLSDEYHIIAISTYGAQRVKDPAMHKTVSAHKIGYSSGAAHILLALYGERARNVSPRQASYIYVQIEDDVVVHHGYILLKVTPDELKRAETTSRCFHQAAAYLWRDGMWRELPNSRTRDYAPIVPGSGPDFNPVGFRLPSPSTGERESVIKGITVERSQREEGGSVWWWLLGDTYPHRELLKRHGARFSGKRKAWYFMRDQLPNAIHALITNQIHADEPPLDPVSPLLDIFGGSILGKEQAPNGDLIVKGENGIFATRRIWISQQEECEPVWVFDLPPHFRVGNPRPDLIATLQRHGALHSIYNQQWRFESAEKVAALDALVESIPLSDDEPCTVDEAAAILGMQVKAVPASELPPRLFGLDDTAYARLELETPDGKPIPTGTRGKVLKLYHHNTKHGWSYDVDFENIGVCWSFERELTPHQPIPGIRITRGAVVPPGAVLPRTDAEIKRTLIEEGQQPAVEEAVGNAEPEVESPVVTDEAQPSAVRIFKPVPMPADGEPLDAVQTAIRAAKAQPLAPVQPNTSNGRIIRIEQGFVGELTGSITGSVWCYGFAVHEGVCIYVNLGGPRMAVEAIRAKLSKGDVVTVVPWDAPAVELTAGEGNTGMYHDYFANIPEAKFTSLILLHDLVINPNYGGKSTTYLLYVSEEQAVGQLHRHVSQLVKVPVFEAWAPYLWSAGQAAMLVRKTRCEGGLPIYAIDLDIDSWTRLITGGITQEIIRLP